MSSSTIFGNVPDDWTVSTLGDIATLQQGLQIAKELRISECKEGYLPLLKITDLPSRIFSEYVTDIKEQHRATKEDIIYTRTGQVGLVYTNLEGCVHNNCFKVNVDYTKFDKLFIYYYLNSKNVYEYANSVAAGSVQKDLKHSAFKSCIIGYPSRKEQKAIAATLSCLDDKIELNNRMNKNLEEMAQAIFKSWFVDFEPFQEGEFEESELGMIPKGWRVDSLYEVFDVIYGAAFKSKLFNEDKIGYPLVRIRDLKTFEPQFYTNEGHPKLEFVNLGDILVGMDAEFRPCIWKGNRGVLNQRVCKFIPKYNYISNYYIYAVIKPHMEFIESFKVGTTVSHIGKGDIDKIKIIIPSKDVLEGFKIIVDPIYNELLSNSIENRILTQLRDTLLPKLMSGEVRVPYEEVI